MVLSAIACRGNVLLSKVKVNFQAPNIMFGVRNCEAEMQDLFQSLITEQL